MSDAQLRCNCGHLAKEEHHQEPDKQGCKRCDCLTVCLFGNKEAYRRIAAIAASRGNPVVKPYTDEERERVFGSPQRRSLS